MSLTRSFRRTQSIQEDLTLSDFIPNLEVKPKKFRVRAVCTSDGCRQERRINKQIASERSDVGIVKRVEKGTDWCPACGYALLWEKIAA